VDKATLKNHRNAYEYRVLVQLAEALPADVKVLIVADRGFGDQKLYRFLTEELKFEYLIRFRGNIAVTSAEGETRPAADWVGVGGRARTLRNAFVTADGYQVGTVVCVHAKDMKEPWCLAASTTTDTAKQLMTTYGKRWGIESGFRDTKDLRFWHSLPRGGRTFLAVTKASLQANAWRGLAVIWLRLRSAARSLPTGSEVPLTASEFQIVENSRNRVTRSKSSGEDARHNRQCERRFKSEV